MSHHFRALPSTTLHYRRRKQLPLLPPWLRRSATPAACTLLVRPAASRWTHTPSSRLSIALYQLSAIRILPTLTTFVYAQAVSHYPQIQSCSLHSRLSWLSAKSRSPTLWQHCFLLLRFLQQYCCRNRVLCQPLPQFHCSASLESLQ